MESTQFTRRRSLVKLRGFLAAAVGAGAWKGGALTRVVRLGWHGRPQDVGAARRAR